MNDLQRQFEVTNRLGISIRQELTLDHFSINE